MNDLKLRSKRLTSSIMALEKLKDYLIKYPEIRLEQLLTILDGTGGRDYFNEEPWDTLERWNNKLENIQQKS